MQRLSIVVLLTGLASFFYFGGELLLRHSSWAEFRTPAGVGELFGLGFSVVVAVAGALGIKPDSLLSVFTRFKGGETQ